jgi:hypothetical protein
MSNLAFASRGHNLGAFLIAEYPRLLLRLATKRVIDAHDKIYIGGGDSN